MSVTFTINNVEPYGVIITDWEMMNLNGTTIFVPKDGCAERKLNLSSVKDQLLKDFLDIGDYLYSNFADGFLPVWGSALDKAHAEYEERLTWSQNAVFDLLNDNNFCFFADPSKKDILLKKVFDFMSRYGFTSGEDKNDICITSAQKIWLSEIQKLYSEAGKPLNISSRFFIKGAFHIIIDIFTTYMACCKPNEYAHKFISVYSEEIYDKSYLFSTDLTLTQGYNRKTKAFEFSNTVFGVIDFISLLLFLINSNAIEQKVITCAYCGKSTLVDNSRSLYCSPTCRNRANAKRSYERKKHTRDILNLEE